MGSSDPKRVLHVPDFDPQSSHSKRYCFCNLETEREPLMTPAALRSMPDIQVLYLFSNRRPTLIDVMPYYESSAMKSRTEAPPPIAAGSIAGSAEFVPL